MDSEGSENHFNSAAVELRGRVKGPLVTQIKCNPVGEYHGMTLDSGRSPL